MLEFERFENYEASAELRDLHKNIDIWFPKRRDWFLSNVGKTLAPNYLDCDCAQCQSIVKNGEKVLNEKMAMRMFTDENRRKLRADGFYFYLV